ncbi:MAG: type II secretion system GspH family protein [Chthoniobacterales bacterium]|nr:type II secretion system GspH family protein [Chthoniobacterales bacterium]
MLSPKSAWTLLEMLVVLAVIAVLSALTFPAEQAWKQKSVQRSSLSLLLRSCEEARSRAITQRLTTWLILQHPTSGKDSFVLLQETENGDTSLITAWKELPKDVRFIFLPPTSTSLPTTFLEKLPQNLRVRSNQLSGIAWNSEGSIVEPSKVSTLSLLTTSNKKIGQILFLRNSGRALLAK